jgi:capsular polysaccharide export protein
MSLLPDGPLVTLSWKLSREGSVRKILAQPLHYWPLHWCMPAAFVGWGHKPNTRVSRWMARMLGRPYIALEDGFLRSAGLGVAGQAAMSIVVDDLGIYYDASQPSRLETLIRTAAHAHGDEAKCSDALTTVRARSLSKYNFFTLAPEPLPPRVVVIDQTVNDRSIIAGGADADTFARMLTCALAENPDVQVWLRRHPDVLAGARKGYLDHVQADASLQICPPHITPIDAIRGAKRVYVVTSQLGFEALIHTVPVSCFGLPWYAGWGLTDDRHADAALLATRRNAKPSLPQIFDAAYLQYCRYLNPVTGQPGRIEDVLAHLARIARFSADTPGRIVCVGLRRWKWAYLRPFLQLGSDQILHVPTITAALQAQLHPTDTLLAWGIAQRDAVQGLAQKIGCKSGVIEDGFLRSVGLGSDFIRPLSLAIDVSGGIYFDATRPSGLEQLLAGLALQPDQRLRARTLIERIVSERLTKYNLGDGPRADWPNVAGRRVLLVPGQVEDDASIRFGMVSVQGNAGLLAAVRQANPGAYIVYKPHPDVQSGNRRADGGGTTWHALADHVEHDCDILACLDACDEVHTMTSLTGFDALLRDKLVTTYGMPFYAGWGLTRDHVHCPRRTRTLDLETLVHAALVLYPRYVSAATLNPCEVEQSIDDLLALRQQTANANAAPSLPRRLRRYLRGLICILRA